MKKIEIELGSNYTHKDGSSEALTKVNEFKMKHPKAKRNDCFDIRKNRNANVIVYDLYWYDYDIGKYNGNSYRRKYARYVEEA